MVREYLCFWSWTHGYSRADCVDVVRIDHPPHEAPKGTILEELVADYIGREHLAGDAVGYKYRSHGIVELPYAHHCFGATYDVAIGGQIASLECCGSQWRVHVAQELPDRAFARAHPEPG